MTILHQLRSTNSTIEKQHTLRSKANSTDLRIFKAAYDPFKMYGLKFNYIDWSTVGYNNIDEMFNLLNKLANREITGNDARSDVGEFSHHFGDLIKLICNKDLDCGVSATTLNKVFGKNFVPQFKCQLATSVDFDKIPLPITGSVKFNGTRVLCFIEDQGVTFRTRNGHTFEFPELADMLHKMRKHYHCDFVLDGELVFGDSSKSDHTKVSGMVNSAIKGTPIYQSAALRNSNDYLRFYAFDLIPLVDFNNQAPTKTYYERNNNILHVINNLYSEFDRTGIALYGKPLDYFIRKAEVREYNTVEDIKKHFDELLEQGFEGLILKRWEHLYSYKRSKDWIKLKDEKTVDLEVTTWEEGQGKYEGGIGALVCAGTCEGKKVEVKVGSGLSDKDRLHSEPASWVGDIIEVKYNTVIQDTKTGQWSLFLPRYIKTRLDKD